MITHADRKLFDTHHVKNVRSLTLTTPLIPKRFPFYHSGSSATHKASASVTCTTDNPVPNLSTQSHAFVVSHRSAVSTLYMTSRPHSILTILTISLTGNPTFQQCHAIPCFPSTIFTAPLFYVINQKAET